MRPCTLLHRKKKVDANQREITRALARAGYHITDLSGCGAGIPDLLITKNKRAYLIEIKNPQGRNRFTTAQIDYYAEVQCLVFVLRGINDVELFIKGEIRSIN